MRPDTIFQWYDQSGIQKEIVSIPVAPLYLTAFSADKGPEGIVEVSGEDFYRYFGSEISFEKHGQPLVQAAHVIDNGGSLLCKRVVAPDATLANIAIIAKVTPTQVQKTNSAGAPLYSDATTNQETTTADGNDPVMINVAKLTYDVYSVPSCTTSAEVRMEVEKLLDEEGGEGTFAYPLYIITDNGRGVSNKRINFTADRDVSKGLSIQLYYLNVIGNDAYETEYTRFTVNPDTVYLNNSMSLTMTARSGLTQVNAETIEANAEAFVAKVAEVTGLEVDYLHNIDLLFGCDKKGKPVPQISYAVEEDTFDLAEPLGIQLLSGDNGTFEDHPIDSADYSAQLVAFFNGTFDDSIFDMNRYVIDAVFDAAYPLDVKQAILELAKFREDFFYFRDIGLGYDTYASIMDQIGNLENNKFAGTYFTTYEVIDPYGRKQIPVTIMYSLAVRMINHFNEMRNAPCCGVQYGFTIPEAIEGTVNFVPKYTPTMDQKTELADNYINYAGYVNGVLTVETEFTSQEPYSQLSFINNILAVQEVIHAVRAACPTFRYSFITSNDLSEYRSNVSDVLQEYTQNFDSLTFEYTQDEIMAANKIFQASIKVTFRNFVQTEIFKIYALASN